MILDWSMGSHFLNTIYVRRLNRRCRVLNLNDLVEGFRGFPRPGGLVSGALGEIGGYSFLSVGDFGDCFCNVIACFNGNGNVKCSFVHLLRGEVSHPSVLK